MGVDLQKVLVIARKEFSDKLDNSMFTLLLVTFTVITFVFSYEYGLLFAEGQGIMFGLQHTARIMAWFSPLVGFALTFNAISDEEISSSLNVFLCHPVYRDNILMGKFLGSTMVLFPALMFSTAISIGTLMFISGGSVTEMELLRTFIFAIILFLYTLAFLGMGLLSSVLVKDASDAVVYNLSLWLIVVMCLFYIVSAISLVSGHDLSILYNLSPMHQYAQLIKGDISIGWGGTFHVSSICGIFDTSYTLSQWFEEFWSQFVILIVIPIILYIASFIAFLRKDITL